ncbi:hypothetical protein SAMN04488074_10441 [Lentzea albidocapillata subsp. violacea]|uniref:Outer membrane channel protein CpnT-like N-terminal domain-containing protein n=1 Tax=Lentzea albidocapillata subsp. violacea TaxID=128104 RepID=A0A1G8YHG7_9PSEU|nr:hypothetical protein [Lentzea albidocapillata]SDK01844.1 hypothetical protein SAMN04488074_10441 [Lentzea albidocapillata subsp. violacea]
MAVAEPGNELWAAVKAIDNTIWPPDNEDDATAIAEDWRKAGETAHLAGTELANAREASRQAWRDQGGQTTGQQLGNGVVTLESQKRDCEQQAAVADRYATALTNVKTAIVQNIEMNLPAYLQYANPMYGASGVARQQEFAQKVAQDLKALVAGQAQGLQAPPAKAPGTDTTMKTVGDIAGMVSAVAGGLALIPVLAPVAAPVALFAGGVAFATHAADMIAKGSYGDDWVGVAGDAAGILPGVKTVSTVVNAAGDLTQLAPKGKDIVLGAFDLAMQAPAAMELAGHDRETEAAVAGYGSAVKNTEQTGEVIYEFLKARRASP